MHNSKHLRLQTSKEIRNMNLRNKWTMGVLGLGAALVIGTSATAVYAQTATPEPPAVGGPQQFTKEDHSALLAEVLGISVEQLQAAQTQARNAAIDQAVAEGRITQEQADQMKQNATGRGFGFGRGGGSDQDALLAQALGITVEQLQAAKAEVQQRLLAEAVASGEITQEEADLMQARQALSEYLRDRMQTAYEAAVAQAVADGVITQAQADQILAEEDGFRFFGGPGMGGGRHHGGPGGPDGPFGFPGGRPNDAPLPPADSTPEESDGTTEPATTLDL
jgi:hypothetical protein